MSVAEAAKKRKQIGLSLLVSAVCVAAILLFIDPIEVAEAVRRTRFLYFLPAALGVLLFVLLRAARWRFMLDGKVPYLRVFHIQNIGYLLSTLLPLRIGDVARAVMIGNVPPVTVAAGMSTMIMERVLDMMFIVVLLPLTLTGVQTLPEWMRTSALATAFLSLVCMVFLVIAANHRPLVGRIATRVMDRISYLNTQSWVRRIDDLLAGLGSLTRYQDGLILAGLSVAVWLPVLGAYYLSLLAVNLQPTWATAGFVLCAAAFSVAAPSAPGQIGVFHAGVIAALSALGQPAVEATSFAILYHALNIVAMVLLGIIGLSKTGSTLSQVVASARQLGRANSASPPESSSLS